MTLRIAFARPRCALLLLLLSAASVLSSRPALAAVADAASSHTAANSSRQGESDLFFQVLRPLSRPVPQAAQPRDHYDGSRPAPIRYAISVNRKALETAISTRRLPIRLPDGQAYELTLEREQTHFTGNRSLVGAVQTRWGRQSAVITLGSQGVFAVLPAPDGKVFQLSTRRGESVIEAAGGMVPAGQRVDPTTSDLRVPPRGRAAAVAAAKWPKALNAAAGAAVDVAVLGVYSSNLVTLNGSVAAAESEFVHQLAVANQAFLDSGVAMRLQLVALRESAIAAEAQNLAVLEAVQANALTDGLDVRAARDAAAADLVAVLRPHAPGDGSCGIAWLSGGDLSPNEADPEYGYSVSNVGSNCGAYVFAHEIGHNLGSHHDLQTALSGNSGRYGAFPYSYGYRQSASPNFATVMAYQQSWSQTWLGQFSRPNTDACLGASCGVADVADNVRSINQMAARVARFRDPANTITVLDAAALESDTGGLRFTVRLASPAPAAGVSFDIATEDDTARAGSDYVAKALSGVRIAAGERTYEFQVDLLNDTEIEPDESFRVRISNVQGASAFSGQAAGMIGEDDDQITLSGRVNFMADTPIPNERFTLALRVSEGERVEVKQVEVSPPSFQYSVSVRRGAHVWAEIDSPPAPYVSLHEALGRFEAGARRDIELKRRPRVRGRLRFPDGIAVPDTMIEVSAMGIEGVSGVGRPVYAFPPDFDYAFDTQPGAQVEMHVYRPPAPFAVLQPVSLGAVESDRQVDLQLRTGVRISGQLRFPDGMTPNRPGSVWLYWSGDTYSHNSVGVYPPDFRFSLAVPAGKTIRMEVSGPEPFSGRLIDLEPATVDRDVTVDIPLAPVARISDVRLAEGNDGQTAARFEIELSHPSEGPAWLSLQSEDGTARANEDYLWLSELVYFAAGETRKVFTVPVFGDRLRESDEFFSLRVTGAYGLQLQQRIATAVLDDDDDTVASPALWLAGAEVLEGDDGNAQAVVRALLSRPAPAEGVQFSIDTLADTALAGSDFEAISDRVIRIAAGQTSAEAVLTIHGDRSSESDEAFSVEASAVQGASLAQSRAHVIIRNDDVGGLPVVGYDHYAVARGGSLRVGADIGLLANDRHPQGQALQVVRFFGTPEHGSIELEADGRFTYTPEPGFTGQDRMIYSVWSGDWATAPQVVGKADFSVVDPLRTSDQYLWLVPPGTNARQQGFIRLINRSDSSGTVSVWGIDASGRRSTGTMTLTLGPKQATHFNSQDLELGNAVKGLSGALGAGDGNWTLVVRSALDIDALAYIRTPDGFVTSMHDRVEGDGVDWVVPLFNPASNPNQVSRLRIVNTSLAAVAVQIVGIDDAGHAGAATITTTLPPLASREYDASDLENGNAAKGLIGQLGDGEGKWRLSVSATDRITVQSLLADPMGYLTNLSTFSTSTIGADHVLWMVTPSDETQQQGFLRLTNLSSHGGTVSLWGVDDRGQRSPGTATLSLAAGETKHLNSQDLELGNASKGLSGSLGGGEGDWRIFLSTDLDLLPMGLIRTPNGFVTTMHDLVLENARTWRVPMFNPGSNSNQVSVLRVVNPGSATVNVNIAGVDDAGRPGAGGTASFTLPANAAVEFTAQELEQGSAARGLVGRLGDGEGKWWLQVSADAEIKVISMLRDPNGYLTNLSNETRGGAAALDP